MTNGRPVFVADFAFVFPPPLDNEDVDDVETKDAGGSLVV
jgi:hypothetical protein